MSIRQSMRLSGTLSCSRVYMSRACYVHGCRGTYFCKEKCKDNDDVADHENSDRLNGHGSTIMVVHKTYYKEYNQCCTCNMGIKQGP